VLRARSRSSLDLRHHEVGRGVLHHVADAGSTISLAFGTVLANGREWMLVDTVLSAPSPKSPPRAS